MLVECGFIRATASDGTEWTFCPSFGRIASLGNPQEIVRLYADLHGPKAAETARYVLTMLCEQDNPSALVGWIDEYRIPHRGLMPPDGDQGQISLARYLMRHGIIGKATPKESGSGQYSDRFDVAEYIAAARIHFGLSSAEAEALSMTEFQRLREMKYPDANKRRDVPTREEYQAAMKAIKERTRG